MVLTGMTVVNPEGISSVIEERGCIMHACTHHDAGDPHVSKVADVWVPVCRHAWVFATDGKKYTCEMTAPTRTVGWLTLRLRENKQDRI